MTATAIASSTLPKSLVPIQFEINGCRPAKETAQCFGNTIVVHRLRIIVLMNNSFKEWLFALFRVHQYPN